MAKQAQGIPADSVGIRVPAGRIAVGRGRWQTVLVARDKRGAAQSSDAFCRRPGVGKIPVGKFKALIGKAFRRSFSDTCVSENANRVGKPPPAGRGMDKEKGPKKRPTRIKRQPDRIHSTNLPNLLITSA